VRSLNRIPIVLAVAGGGAVGTVGRVAVFDAFDTFGLGVVYPLIIVNLFGALALGWYVGRTRSADSIRPNLVAFTAAGLLGSFTTFSGFALETVDTLQAGSVTGATIIVLVSLGGGVGMATIGRIVATR
jgi:CrcB protein